MVTLFKAVALLFLLVIPFKVVFILYEEFNKNMYKGLALGLSCMIGYMFFAVMKTIQNDFYYAFLDEVFHIVNYETGRLMLAFFCLLAGLAAAKIFSKAFNEWRTNNIFLFMIMLFSVIHAGLIDVFRSYSSKNEADVYLLLPTITFIQGIGLYTVVNLFNTKKIAGAKPKNDIAEMLKREEEDLEIQWTNLKCKPPTAQERRSKK